MHNMKYLYRIQCTGDLASNQATGFCGVGFFWLYFRDFPGLCFLGQFLCMIGDFSIKVTQNESKFE